jgi:hypothetical protein
MQITQSIRETQKDAQDVEDARVQPLNTFAEVYHVAQATVPCATCAPGFEPCKIEVSAMLLKLRMLRNAFFAKQKMRDKIHICPRPKGPLSGPYDGMLWQVVRGSSARAVRGSPDPARSTERRSPAFFQLKIGNSK